MQDCTTVFLHFGIASPQAWGPNPAGALLNGPEYTRARPLSVPDRALQCDRLEFAGDTKMAHDDVRNEPVTRTIGRVIDDVRDLFREEIALAKAELRHEATEFGGAVARMGVGVGAGLFALGFLLLGAAQGLADLVGWPAWGGYLAMAAVLGIGALIALKTGRSRVKQIPTLPRTVESIKETKEWMNSRTSSSTK
jgi:putative superfamily III holin-X